MLLLLLFLLLHPHSESDKGKEGTEQSLADKLGQPG